MAEDAESVKTSKGEQTRALILETALELFRERGYEETTMRAIAERAGVSLGNAYYYFKSKEHLIQAFYNRTHEQHRAAAAPILEREKDLKERLRGVLLGILSNIEPYHRFSGILFKTAADPSSPLNPFSPESSSVRQANTELFAQVLRDSKVKVPVDLQAELPNLLWMYHMGIVLFWIHDTSPGRVRTFKLLEHTADIVARLIKLASNPILAPVRKRALKLLTDLKETVAEVPPDGVSGIGRDEREKVPSR